MKTLLQLSLLVYMLFFVVAAQSQMENYSYKRSVNGIEDEWHKLNLPDDLFEKTRTNMADIRVFGITANQDTLETPYLLETTAGKSIKKEIPFDIINVAHTPKGYYFTFELSNKTPINHIHLAFQEANFDWNITLQGSQHQEEWFTLLENYRILSIQNNTTDFQFTKLSFPSATYRYFRVFIPSATKPSLKKASLTLQEQVEAIYKAYPVHDFSKTEEKETKKTIIDVELPHALPISFVQVDVDQQGDYYRPVQISYVADSVQTEKGWHYTYHQLTDGILNSFEKNQFEFSEKKLKNLRLVIKNHDNSPLNITGVNIKGFQKELIARFSEKADYFLTYGNPKAKTPNYDLKYFKNTIPESIPKLQLGVEQTIKQHKETPKSALFQNKSWLWAIMLLIIVALGGFTMHMIKKS